MSELFCLADKQMRRIERYFPLSHGVPRVDDGRAISGIFVIKNGLRWRDAPADYGPHKTIYNRFLRWSRLGVLNRIFAGLSAEGPRPERLMIDTTHLKAHRTAASLLKRGCSPTYRTHEGRRELQAARRVRRPGPPAGHAALRGQVSDYKGAALMLDVLPQAKVLLADRGYDADWFRGALSARGIAPCIPPRAGRKVQIGYDKTLYRQRHKIEIMFGRRKDWRRIHTRYDRCARTLTFALAIAATVIFWA